MPSRHLPPDASPHRSGPEASYFGDPIGPFQCLTVMPHRGDFHEVALARLLGFALLAASAFALGLSLGLSRDGDIGGKMVCFLATGRTASGGRRGTETG